LVSESLSLYLQTARKAAYEAGEILLAAYRKIGSREKGPGDLVTDADFASQRRIAEIVLEAFPEHGFLGEEEGSNVENSSGYRWVVDPLDGTINFAHGVEPWSVSIALEREGELIVGVVYVPLSGTMYSAAAGEGATENDRPMRTSGVGKLAGSLIAAGMPTNFAADSDRQLAIMKRLSTGTHSVRRMGSSAWNLARLAAGGFEVCYATSVHWWDVAAGVLLVREAGGLVTNLAGSRFDRDRPELLASNGTVHQEVLAAIQEAWPRIGRVERDVVK
jgi:myo-inositol-1(or 4)-monophosphatase